MPCTGTYTSEAPTPNMPNSYGTFGSQTTTATGPTGGQVNTGLPAGFTNNNDGTATDQQGNIYSLQTGGVVGFQNSDGTWTDTSGNLRNSSGAIVPQTTDQVLQRAGAAPIGGSAGGSTSPIGGGGSSGGSSSGNSSLASTIQSLAQLAQQALAANNQQQLAAIRLAQTRLGVAASVQNTSNTGKFLLIGGVALGLYALANGHLQRNPARRRRAC